MVGASIKPYRISDSRWTGSSARSANLMNSHHLRWHYILTAQADPRKGTLRKARQVIPERRTLPESDAECAHSNVRSMPQSHTIQCYPLAPQSSILSAASSQASANSKNSCLAAGVVRRFSEFSIFSRLLAIIVGVVHSTQFLADTTEEKLPLLVNH